MTPPDRLRAVERLTALWALGEAGLGWFLHALKVPFAGTLIAASAVMIICLIAHYAEKRSLAILKALTIVLVIKAAVSPYSPLTAYFAVCFQAFAGAALFTLVPRFRVAALLLGILSLTECAVQRLLFLTILYGNSLWDSIDVFVRYVGSQIGFGAIGGGPGPSAWIITLYLLVYAAAGVAAGLLGGALPRTIENAVKAAPPFPLPPTGEGDPAAGGGRRRKPLSKRKLVRCGVWLVFIAATFTFLAPAVNGAALGAYVVLRSVAVLLAWYFVAAPLLMKGLRRVLRHKESGYGQDIGNALALFPVLKQYARQYLDRSEGKRGLRWGWQFLVSLIVFGLSCESPESGREGAGPGGGKSAGTDESVA